VLAVDRAGRLSNIQYKLDLSLRDHAETMPGRESISFTLKPGDTSRDLWLDFRDGTLQSVALNGGRLPAELNQGHLRLPAARLQAGANSVEIHFTARVAAAGAAITRYSDKEDGSEYLYSLFVPMDASMAFPCFDQPDLKGRFTLSVSAPHAWTVISNTVGATTVNGPLDGEAVTSFQETRPISTYLFAFAAGPWVSVHPMPGLPNVYVRKSQVKRAEPEIPQLQEITKRGMLWLADYFQQPFPFPKYDIVLIPGFPFGGMEHAGATFLREDGVLFRSAPTANDRFNRNILTLHELTHQWFGDLVTMRWFDDLWLKEGFAQYMAYRCLDSLEPDSQAWKHFYESIKPLAYDIDETPGTTPIFQNIPNLKDAKSAYGAIVYEKAPAILKQLEFRLGADNFRNGLRLYLAQHAYGNAQWADLISAFHSASGQDVRSWADAWVLRRGMPEVNVNWSCNAQGKLDRLTLTQQDVLPDHFIWPISNEVLLGTSGKKIRVDWNTASREIPEATGQLCPAFVFANTDDKAYGRFLLDAQTEHFVRDWLIQHPAAASTSSVRHTVPDPLLRSMLWGALWDNVRVARSSPRSYTELALRDLPTEDDETLAGTLGSHSVTALHLYMTARGRSRLVPQLEQIATQRMSTASTPGLRIVGFRTLNGVAETQAARSTFKQLLAEQMTIPGVALRPLDRWSLVGALIAFGDPDAQRIFTEETQRDTTDDGRKYAWAVQAGAPDAAVKQSYFNQYLLSSIDAGARPEDWLTQSLRPFNSWNQNSLTEPYVRRALDQLPEIKRDRKIFFLGAWLGSFLTDQTSADAERAVQQWLTQPGIDPDLRLKVLENNDELERTIRIRQRFPD
jgi:aminopeptidase N